MKKYLFKPSLLTVSLIGLSCIYSPANFAAVPVDLSNAGAAKLQTLLPASKGGIELQETKRMVGGNKTLHIRFQQTYQHHPVIGTDAVIHLPKANKKSINLSLAVNQQQGKMSGFVYQSLQSDLANANPHALGEAGAKKAMQHALDLYYQKGDSKAAISEQNSQLMVFVDQDNKAHYVYKVSFLAEPSSGKLPELATYLMDAVSLHVYQQWDDSRSAMPKQDLAPRVVAAGGFGGNKKSGKVTYDGSAGNKPSFLVTRDGSTGICTMQNPNAKLKRNRNNNPDNLLLTFSCPAPDPSHNNVYWSDELINANDSYSTANDPMAHEQLVRKMFQEWYGLPLLAKNGVPVPLAIVISCPDSGARFADAVTSVLSIGDGAAGLFYSFVERDIIAHELSHGFTPQYAKFGYTGEGAAIGESFGDITAKAVEYYVTGTNSWTFAGNVMRLEAGLRYFDQPTKDCRGTKTPGDWCSIDNLSQYHAGVWAHYASGLFNRMFYNLSNTPGWGFKKSYDVMVAANMYYWTSTTNFAQGACGVVNSARDFGYDGGAVQAAFQVVGIDASAC